MNEMGTSHAGLTNRRKFRGKTDRLLIGPWVLTPFFFIDETMSYRKVQTRKAPALDPGLTRNTSASCGFPPDTEEFLTWVRERHGDSVSRQCREIISKNVLWGKKVDGVQVLNSVIYPADKTFQRSKIGKIKFVV